MKIDEQSNTQPEVNIQIVSLEYDVFFEDSDYGLSYAGDGSQVVRVFQTAKDAKLFIKKWTPVLKRARKGFYNKRSREVVEQLCQEFGIDFYEGLYDKNYRFKVEEWAITPPNEPTLKKPN